MTVRFSKRQLVFLFTLLIVISAFFGVLYLYTLKPLYNRMDELSTTVANEKRLLAAMQARAVEQQTHVTESVVELQKKVPVKPLVEQLLLDLEKAEVVSDSFISSMVFNEAAEMNTSEQQATANNANTQGTENEMNPSTTEEQPPSQQSETSFALPSGLKKISVQLTVQSPSYYHLERFLETLEGLTRIVSVEALSFTGNPELTSIDTEVKPLTYSLTVSAFYHPGLVNLQDQVPPLDVPPPSEKRNPLTELIPNETKREETSP
ncbi:type IV pilus assembly protein PilO [Anoxybacillus calidus]|jgi:type IV pilus assembly protein PilO|uniref:Type IV pilus assembly protein PilO n=1 Tax=[Anoxybacillus] calidus TaxID=575178 RepID=A0A7W0BWU8_9BACL|nr:pilus assembly protein PilO [Anoxybacillus calidus]MBA2871616.1 type IV pilus assembly protein PilO [Anoxybacillus calidus]